MTRRWPPLLAPVTAVLWVAQEALRGRVPFGGFPWARLAFSQDGSPLLRQHAEKLELLPMGLDLAAYANPSLRVIEHARELKRRFGEPIWLCVGRCVYYKGLNTAIDALTAVPGTLIVIGQGPLQRDLREQARRRGVGDRVVWWGYATQEEFAWHNEWRVGDLVLWDNRCTMHRRDPFEAASRRIMHRTQIKGETRPRV